MTNANTPVVITTHRATTTSISSHTGLAATSSAPQKPDGPSAPDRANSPQSISKTSTVTTGTVAAAQVERVTRINAEERALLKQQHPLAKTPTIEGPLRSAASVSEGQKLLNNPNLSYVEARLNARKLGLLTAADIKVGQVILVKTRADGQFSLIENTAANAAMSANGKDLAAQLKQRANLARQSLSTEQLVSQNTITAAKHQSQKPHHAHIASLKPFLTQLNVQVLTSRQAQVSPTSPKMQPSAFLHKLENTAQVKGSASDISKPAASTEGKMPHAIATIQEYRSAQQHARISHAEHSMRPFGELANFSKQLQQSLNNVPEHQRPLILPINIERALTRILARIPDLASLLNTAEMVSSSTKHQSPNPGEIIKQLLNGQLGLVNTDKQAASPGATREGEFTVNPGYARSMQINTLSKDLYALREMVVNNLQQMTTIVQLVQQTPQSLQLGGLDALMQALFKGKNTSLHDKTRQLSGMILSKLQGNIDTTLAKLQHMQLQTASRKSSESSQAHGQLQIELPLRFGDQYGSLFLDLRQKEYEASHHDDKQRDDRETKTVQSQWQVFLAFEFDEHDTLSTEIKLSQDTVSAKLWASNDDLASTVASHIHLLEDRLVSAGMTVNGLDCCKGQAPSQPVGVQHALVDIRT